MSMGSTTDSMLKLVSNRPIRLSMAWTNLFHSSFNSLNGDRHLDRVAGQTEGQNLGDGDDDDDADEMEDDDNDVQGWHEEKTLTAAEQSEEGWISDTLSNSSAAEFMDWTKVRVATKDLLTSIFNFLGMSPKGFSSSIFSETHLR